MRGFSTGSGAGTPAESGGRSQRALSEPVKVQPAMQTGRGPGGKGVWTGRGGGLGAALLWQGNSRVGTRFRIRKGHSVLHTCPLKIRLSPRPDVLPSVCPPPTPETSRGPESTSRYTGLVSPFVPSARFLQAQPRRRHESPLYSFTSVDKIYLMVLINPSIDVASNSSTFQENWSHF